MGRQSGKARRYALDETTDVRPLPVPETVEDVRKALGLVMSNLVARRLDARTASSMAYVSNVMLKAIELSDLEKRMKGLEQLLKTTGEGGHAARPVKGSRLRWASIILSSRLSLGQNEFP
jgi:hypothetical protein